MEAGGGGEEQKKKERGNRKNRKRKGRRGKVGAGCKQASWLSHSLVAKTDSPRMMKETQEVTRSYFQPKSVAEATELISAGRCAQETPTDNFLKAVTSINQNYPSMPRKHCTNREMPQKHQVAETDHQCFQVILRQSLLAAFKEKKQALK